jgi:hypothetical protein
VVNSICEVQRTAAQLSRTSLGSMSTDVPLAFMQFAVMSVLAHLISTIALRLTVRARKPIVVKLFAEPFLGGLLGTPWYLRARFFWPWTTSPEELSQCSPVVHFLFWVARLAGGLFAVAIVGFLCSEVYLGIHAA